jgi:predicted ferric reductase
VPIAVAVVQLRSADFASAGAVLNALGRLSGVAGLAFLLVAAILSCRVPGFDRPFGGLTKLWQTHHRLGGVAFLLVLVHPVLLALGAAEVSTAAAARTLVPALLDSGAITGWGALLVLARGSRGGLELRARAVRVSGPVRLARPRHMAALERAAEAGPFDARLVYCVQDHARAHFCDELEAIAERVSGFSMTMHYYYREGPLRHEFLAQHCPDFAERTAYVCGPVPLMALAERLLVEAGRAAQAHPQ